ncbi:MAG: glyoxalase [Acidobacteria bacterium]|nr:MAG: glyoxalase [Acidobacteriota bacterium]
MSSTQVSTERQPATGVPNAATVDLKLEAIPIPVSDVDRAKAFYGGLGWRLDADFMIGKTFRAVQLTPPGSPCSIHLVTKAVPGSAQGMFLVVSDIDAARRELIARGVDVSGVFHFDGDHDAVPGPDAERPSYGSYASFTDPDGNRWILQQVTTRLPGRGLSLDVATLTELFQETEKRHGTYEPTAPKHHWSGWYAAYVVARERGRTPDEAANDATLHIKGALAAQA